MFCVDVMVSCYTVFQKIYEGFLLKTENWDYNVKIFFYFANNWFRSILRDVAPRDKRKKELVCHCKVPSPLLNPEFLLFFPYSPPPPPPPPHSLLQDYGKHTFNENPPICINIVYIYIGTTEGIFPLKLVVHPLPHLIGSSGNSTDSCLKYTMTSELMLRLMTFTSCLSSHLLCLH